MWERIIQSPIIDVLDILIVALILYRLLAFVRDTRAVQMFMGLGLLMILSFIASSLGMIVVNRIIGTLQTVSVVAFIILFQPELRAALADLGMRRGLRILRENEEIPAEREILHAVERLSRRGLGALIVLEREIRLGRWIKTGTSLNADISAATLESIFTVPGPLHDGAVIIGQGKILAASCILPITERKLLGYVLGTRHRAAVGLSEVSDAIIIVVSEESRAISLAYHGDIKRGLTIEDLTAEINRIAFTRGRKPEKSETAPA